jgi:hypothetical protein
MLSIVQAKIGNPAIGNLGDMNSTEFFGSLVSTLISLMLVLGGILLLIMILKGGIEWIMAEGDKGRVENARKTITNAIIGIVILFSFYAIINLIGCIFGINFFEIQVGEFNVSFGNNPFCGSAPSGGSDMGCFTEGTKITMADGSTKYIEQINVGDAVISYDFDKETNIPNSVVKTTKHEVAGFYIINDSISVTGNHEFYLPDTKQWIRVDQLKTGDVLINFNKEQLKIMKIEKVKQNTTVYNFEVESPHNYYANNVLVHNAIKP